MTITITAFERSPDRGMGLARDTRVRWALEEVGQPYEVRLVSFAAMKEPAHLKLHPFGKIPTYEEGDLVLFETGSIILHIAERQAGLLPNDANARARAITWMFAALNTVEPPILELANAKLLESDKPWSKERLPLVADRVRGPLKQLSARLGEADWLDGAFSAGDLMMVHVLQRLKPSGLLNKFPSLAAYVARGEARPGLQAGFRRAVGGEHPQGVKRGTCLACKSPSRARLEELCVQRSCLGPAMFASSRFPTRSSSSRRMRSFEYYEPVSAAATFGHTESLPAMERGWAMRR